MIGAYVGSQYPRNFWPTVSFAGYRRARKGFGDDGDGSVDPFSDAAFGDTSAVDAAALTNASSQQSTNILGYSSGLNAANNSGFSTASGAAELGVAVSPTSVVQSEIGGGLGITADNAELGITNTNSAFLPNASGGGSSSSSSGSAGGILGSIASLFSGAASAITGKPAQTGTQIKTAAPSSGFLGLSGTSLALAGGGLALVLFLATRPKRVVVADS